MKLEPSFVEDFLYAVGRHRGGRDEEFENEVRLQIAHGEVEYRDAPERSLLHFVGNRREEAADIAAWAIPELDQLNRDVEAGKIDADLAHECRMRMIEDAAIAQHLWRRMTDTFNMLSVLPHN